MAYYTDLFSPETYEAFSRSDRTVSGFRIRQHNVAKRIKPGDKLLCYMTKLSRWGGVLEVVEGPFTSEAPIFYPEADPFVVRFKVTPVVWLPVEKAVPIHDASLWKWLSFTKNFKRADAGWTGKLRASLVPLSQEDGETIEQVLRTQAAGGKTFPVNEEDYRKLVTHKVRRADKDVTVTVPEEKPVPDKPTTTSEARESIQIQALLADIGARMGMKIWIPRSDKAAVLAEWKGEHAAPLERLPLNYDETTLKTIEQIDVIWLKGRAITRAFEVEHTTSVYSGLLRMADLLALQPNMDIRLHIVAPAARREKVFQEIRRPVFSLLERAALSEVCTFLSYDSLHELADQPHLVHLSDSVLDEYEESAED